RKGSEQKAQDGMDMALCHLSPALSEGDGEPTRKPSPSIKRGSGGVSKWEAVGISKGQWVLEFAGANNPLYIFRKGIENSELAKNDKIILFGESRPESNESPLNDDGWGGAEISGDKTPIGGDTHKFYDFTTHKINLQKGDTIYMFSDGYHDQFGGAKGKKFMKKRFKQLLLDIVDKPMTEQKEILNKTIEDWKGITEQVDDILIIGVRV
ncbi:MAG: SpoIIE family protein phosphatase, partial [Bacteroidota bacterium]